MRFRITQLPPLLLVLLYLGFSVAIAPLIANTAYTLHNDAPLLLHASSSGRGGWGGGEREMGTERGDDMYGEHSNTDRYMDRGRGGSGYYYGLPVYDGEPIIVLDEGVDMSPFPYQTEKIPAPAVQTVGDPGRCNKNTYKALNKYLNSFNSLQANFVQYEGPAVTSNEQSEIANRNEQLGVLYILKPGKLRLEYQKPKSHFLILNNGTMSYYDASLDEVSHIPTQSLSEVVDILASHDVSIETYKSIKGCHVGDDGITVIGTDGNDRGLVMIFDNDPVAIKEIATIDANGLAINEIYLSSIIYNQKTDSTLFTLKDSGFFNDNDNSNR